MKERHTLVVLFVVVLSVAWLSSSRSQDKKNGEGKMEPRISLITLGVSDLERSFHFYQDGLGFPTKMTPEKGIVVFATSGTRLALYSYGKLAEDVGFKRPESSKEKPGFPGVTLGHCARSREEVDKLLALAEKAGGRIVKKAQDVSWGGYSGYFSDPDGYSWEVAYSDQWKFNADGSLALE